MFFTYCSVIVDPPWTGRPWRFASNARAMPRGSTPLLEKKVRSSDDTSTFSTIGATWLSFTGTRFSEVNVASTEPSTASIVEYWGSGGMTSGGSPLTSATRFAAPTITVELTWGTSTIAVQLAINVTTRSRRMVTRRERRERTATSERFAPVSYTHLRAHE